MRHQPEVEQMTRLLVQKEKAYADLDEMSRMAITVLSDEGWKFSRVGMDMRVLVTADPMIQGIDSSAVLAEAQAKFILLRREFEELQAARIEHLVMVAGIALTMGTFVVLVGLGKWLSAPGILLIGTAGWMNQKRTKGAE